VVLLVLVLVRVEHRAVRLHREEQAREVAEHEDDRDPEREVLDLGAEGVPLLADRGQAAAVDQLERRRQDQSGECEQQHRGLRVRRGAVEGLLVARPAAHEHRSAEHEQHVADDRTDDRCLHHLMQALLEREEGDDQLGCVPECHVQEAADARPGALGELLGRCAHERRRGDDADRGCREDEDRRRVRELERDGGGDEEP
jgi:hypothetical protein